MSQLNVNTAAQESTETIFLTTNNVAYRYVRETLYQHIESGLVYTASTDGRLFDLVDLKEVTMDGRIIFKPVEQEGRIKIGQMVGTDRLGRGVVYCIYGQQGKTPINALCGGAIVSGGSAEFDIVFYNGSRISKLHEAILCKGRPWYIYDEVVSQDEINNLIIKADENDKKIKDDKEKEANDFTRSVENLKVNTDYQHLIQVNDKYSEKVAAKNIRIELKRLFKGIKFSVRKEHFDCLNIKWTDGPKKEEVEEVTSKYKTGRFNSYEDYSYSEVGPFNAVFGGLDYIFLSREFSDEFIQEAIGVLVDKYESNFHGKELPTPEDYRKGRLYNQGQEFCVRSLQEELWIILSEI